VALKVLWQPVPRRVARRAFGFGSNMFRVVSAALIAGAAAWVPSARPRPYSGAVARSMVTRSLQILPPTQTQSSEPKVKPVVKINITDSPTIVVTGFADADERTDQFVFDVLHSQDVWGKIVALVPDVPFAKKRLLSRSARYTGLLDVLEIEEFDLKTTLGGGSAALASALKGYGADAWLNFATSADALEASYDAAEQAGVTRLVSVVDGGAVDADAVVAASKRATPTLAQNALMITGELVDGVEGGALATSLLRKARAGALDGRVCVRDDAVRVAAEAFVLKGAQNASFTLAQGNENDGKYLRYLREMGADRQEELDALIGGDRSAFVEMEAKEKEKKKKAEAAERARAAGGGFDKFKTCPNGTIVTIAQFESDWQLMKALTDEKLANRRKAEVCTKARAFLETEFEKFLYGRRDRGHTFEPYCVEHWHRGVYEVSVRMNLIPRDDHIEMEKKRWSRWIGKSMRCPPQLKAVFPEIYPADEWDKHNAIVSDDVVHTSGGMRL